MHYLSNSLSIELLANIIGIVGTALVVLSYCLFQLNKLDPHGMLYTLMNLFGAIFLLISLCVHFNLASFIIEVFWILASLVGLYRALNPTKSEDAP